jgi:hypothetical protein
MPQGNGTAAGLRSCSSRNVVGDAMRQFKRHRPTT